MKHLLLVVAMMLTCFSMAMAQSTVSGTVTDESGETLPFANVYVKGTTIGTTTDLDGKYTLEVPEGATTLVIEYTGYTVFNQEIGNDGTIDAILSQGVNINEVVVIGSCCNESSNSPKG